MCERERESALAHSYVLYTSKLINFRGSVLASVVRFTFVNDLAWFRFHCNSNNALCAHKTMT